jgi:L-ascorbate metabolism protein UlaG (beta-lactamase superfamily)
MDAAALAQSQAQAVADYPARWAALVADWRANGPGDAAWLTYAANYLLRTGEARWAIDPLTLPARVPGAAEVNLAPLRERLDFLVLTHSHNDHLDLSLLRRLRAADAWWVVPPFLVGRLTEAGLLPRRNLIVPPPLEPFEIAGVTLTTFDSLHFEPQAGGSSPRGVPEIGLLAEWPGGRWLFPGDIRHYEPTGMPGFGRLDGVFAHLWLGRRSARQNPPPLLDEFCRFHLSLNPSRLVLTHLNELGRAADDRWTPAHAAQTVARLRQLCPALPVQVAQTGERVELGAGRCKSC